MLSSFFSIFRKSFTSFKSYTVFLTLPFKKAFFYFLTLISLLSALSILIQLPAFILTLTELTDWAVRKLPAMRIEHGQMEPLKGASNQMISLEELSPVFGKNLYLLIDPTQEEANTKDPNGILFKKHKILIKDQTILKVISFPKDLSVTISDFTLMQWRDILGWLSPIYLFLRTFINLTVLNGFEVLLLGTLCFLGIKILRKNIPFKICLSITTVSMTPALTLAFIFQLLNIYFPFLPFIFMAIYLIYTIGALRACLQSQNEEVIIS